jgi:hypothetical protein
MTNKQYSSYATPSPSREDRVNEIIDQALNHGHYNDTKHAIDVHQDYTIWVRDIRANKRVAYSSTKADFEQSLVEFVTDYFV